MESCAWSLLIPAHAGRVTSTYLSPEGGLRTGDAVAVMPWETVGIGTAHAHGDVTRGEVAECVPHGMAKPHVGKRAGRVSHVHGSTRARGCVTCLPRALEGCLPRRPCEAYRDA